jgi:translocation and assembly module TamB
VRKLLSHPLTVRTRRIIKAIVVVLAVMLAVFLVTAITVDLGPALKAQAEKQGANYLKRGFHIGGLSVRLATGKYIVEDLVIDGLTPQSRPWLKAKRIEVSMPWSTLFDRRIVFDTIEMTDWDMYVEQTKDGRSSFPKFPTRKSEGPKVWTTTLQYVRAYRGQFTYDDQGTPWKVITRNLDVTVARPSTEYRGQARFSDGQVAFQQYVPFRIDMNSAFKIVDGQVKFDRIDLESTGAHTQLVGTVDLNKWPEQTYTMKSTIDFPAQKAIWFAKDKFTVSGVGEFNGTFHMFKEQLPGRSRTGRELKGTFTAPVTGVNAYRFGDLEGSVLWTPDKLLVDNATTTLYGGKAKFSYLMQMGQNGARTQNTFDAFYENVDLTTFTNFLELEGMRLAGRASGHNLLQWPIGLWSEHHGNGELHATAPEGVAVLSRELPVSQIERRYAQPKAFGPFSAHLPQAPIPIGGDITYSFGRDWVDIGPSRIATPETYVEMEGRTAYGEQSNMPFHVSSADWQESDRFFAAVLTAFGSSTNAIQVGGYGTFDGVMLNSFRRPRIEGTFTGERMSAFDVEWGSARGSVVIENSYADVKDAVVTSGDSTITADGRFSLGYPRRDNGEELDARIGIVNRPIEDLRHAFELDEYRLDGRLSGDFRVYGRYTTPLGVGKMTIANGIAYGEEFESATASLRLEGNGVTLDPIEMVKGAGRGTGRAVVQWNGTYSFTFDGKDIPLEAVTATKSSPLPVSGRLQFTAGGSGSFDMPRYDVHASIVDLFVKDEGVGQVVGDININGDLLTMKLEAASPRLAVSGNGRLTLNDQMDVDMTFQVSETSLDPYVRAYDPRLSPYTNAVASGTVRVVGELADIDYLVVDAMIDRLDARLFDYELRNAPCPMDQAGCVGRLPIRVALDRHSIRVTQMKLAGEGTELDINGTVFLHDERIDMRVKGDASLAVAQGFLANIRSSGRATLDATLAGAVTDPAVSGTLTIDNGRVRHFALPHSLENIMGTARFDSRGVTLDGLTGRLGDGPVQFFGRIDKQGFLPARLDLQMFGQGMTLRFPEGMRSKVDASLFLQGTPQGATLTGDVYVRDALYTRTFETDILNLVGSAVTTANAGGGGLQQPVPLRYDVRITAPQSLRIDNNVLRLVASADLQLRGTFERPTLLGNTEINRGDMLFEGRRYVVTRGSIDFNNPNRIEPFFDVEAQTRVRVPGDTYIVSLRAVGTPSRVTFDLSADPPLPELEILALLFSDVNPDRNVEFRRFNTDITPQQQLLRDRASRALTESVTSGVGRAVQQAVGIDTFQITPTLIDPNSQAARLEPGARLTIGQRLTDKVYLTYSRSQTSSTRNQIILLEYDQTDRLSWVLSRNEDRTYAIDVRVRRVF